MNTSGTRVGPETTAALATFAGRESDLNEDLREYLYVGRNIRIEKPRKLFISQSGNHRVRTEDGLLYIVAPGWLAIRIEDSKQDWTF